MSADHLTLSPRPSSLAVGYMTTERLCPSCAEPAPDDDTFVCRFCKHTQRQEQVREIETWVCGIHEHPCFCWPTEGTEVEF